MRVSAAIDAGAQRFNGCPFAASAGVAEVILRPHAWRILGRYFYLFVLRNCPTSMTFRTWVNAVRAACPFPVRP